MGQATSGETGSKELDPSPTPWQTEAGISAERIGHYVQDADGRAIWDNNHGDGGVCRWADAVLMAAAPDMLTALKVVNRLVSEAAMTGFNCHDGDWAERLYQSQQATSRAIARAEGR